MGSFGSPFLCGLRPFSAKKLTKNTDSLVHMLLLQQEWREEAHHGVLRAVEQHSLCESLLDDGAAGNIEIDALNEAASPHFLRRGVTINELLKFMLKVCPDRVDVGEQVLFFHNRQILQRDTRGERPAAEGSAMLTRGDSAGEFFARQKCAERKSGGDWLGDANDIGLNAKALEGEEIAGSAQAALDFVEDERGLGAVGNRAALLEKLDRALQDSTFPEDGLEHDGAGLVIDGGAQRFHIVARDERDFFQQRLESLAVFVLSGQRHGAESSTVVRTLEADEAALFGTSAAMAGKACQLDRAFNRFGAAVGKENPVQT